jgi:hypothetical protein
VRGYRVLTHDRGRGGVSTVRLGEGAFRGVLHLLQALLEQRVDDLFLVGEAPIGGTDADAEAGVVGDVVQRDVEAAFGEQLTRSRQQTLTVLRGVGELLERLVEVATGQPGAPQRGLGRACTAGRCRCW